MHFTQVASALALAGSALAWLPKEFHQGEQPHARVHARDHSSQGKTLLSRDGVNLFEKRAGGGVKTGIQGVNLGSLFVFEPWIAQDLWNAMCGADSKSEFDCVSKLGQDAANKAFQNHWKTWITQDDFDQMAKLGLNTVRIPVGYWMYEDIVDSTEHFPQGGIDALANVCDMAAKSGLYIIIDQHGAPGAQIANNPDSGQYNPNPGFFTDYNYNRSQVFLGWMAGKIHDDNRFRNVGMLEALNEPEQNSPNDQSMRQDFYPGAMQAVRNVENDKSVPAGNTLHVFYMNKDWSAGAPTQYLPTTANTAYDDHRYIKWAYQQEVSQQAYAKTSCNDNRGQTGLTTVVGEWSLAVADSVQDAWDVKSNKDWYAGWFAAQTVAYTKLDVTPSTNGWIFWTWKTSGLNDPRWDYQMAASSEWGIIPTDLTTLPALAKTWCAKSQ